MDDPKEIIMGYADEAPVLKGNSIHGVHAMFAANFLRGRPRRKLDRNTYAILNAPSNDYARYSDGSISIRLHDTDVVRVYPDDSLEINYGRWNTVTTRDRINNHLPAGWAVYTERGDLMWLIRDLKIMNPRLRIKLPASNGDKILADGTLVMHDKPIYSQRRKLTRTWHGTEYPISSRHND